MILYHGSNIAFDKIDLTQSKHFKDFNCAFYLSAEENQAKEMAANKADFLGGTPIVQAYEFDECLLCDDSLKVNYRHGYDIVYGPIANDTIGLQMREFRRSHLTLEGFLE